MIVLNKVRAYPWTKTSRNVFWHPWMSLPAWYTWKNNFHKGFWLTRSNGTKATYRKTSASVNFKPDEEKKPASILPALCLAFGGQFLFGALLKLINDCLMFLSPQLLKWVICSTLFVLLYEIRLANNRNMLVILTKQIPACTTVISRYTRVDVDANVEYFFASSW